LGLLPNSSAEITPHQRVDGATVYKDFTKSVKEAGGSDRAIPRAVQAETQELFACNVNELYEETGGKVGDRASLPTEAQKAYMVNETLSKYVLDKGTQTGNQKQTDETIVEVVKEVARETRKWFPW
jgi:hypothetical protein